MYARYRTRSRFYKQPERALKAYGVSPNFFRKPKVKRQGLLHGIYADETVDLREKERLELLEEIRHPRERDFYQDHTYHNQWVDRELESHQKVQIGSRYKYFDPDFAVKPWLWYPGDVVEVVNGSEGVGQRGTIIAAIPYKNEIIVQHINIQDITIPASDTRPEQVIQREHPISIDRVRHVDPSTNELCNVALVKVLKKGTTIMEERRICLETGVLLPIPPKEDPAAMETGDPLRDTPYQDAEEETYDGKKEMELLVNRKLKAMENYFVGSVLKSSYEFHQPLRRANAAAMKQFQKDVVSKATSMLSEKLCNQFTSSDLMKKDPDSIWWKTMIGPYVEDLEAEVLEEQERANQELADREEQERAEQPLVLDEEMEDEEGYYAEGDGGLENGSDAEKT